MKKTLLILIICTIGVHTLVAQNKSTLRGAFLHTIDNKNVLWLFVDDYFSAINFENNRYISTTGGPFTYDGKTIHVSVEYNDANPEQIGSTIDMPVQVQNQHLRSNNMQYNRQPAKAQDLDGLWRITGRKQGNELSTITRGDRKTIKLLVDGYFQWIAINPAVKGFYGTGGGTYVFTDGKYTEHILYFSRDNSRVGADLSFEGKIEANQWHHSGLSSKGDPIFEIWSRDNQ
ncbi:hypothetical protein [Sphingobacterium psychroaquaticum]|uniref:Uncharacterized protein n=1 Tax=Sphingobacterium psychroaquaticum TaxID=561061 RepID=A0A1X7KMS5_9SPHI|nr:hypothetical protein [Sphingobacterium psychroaquaticum]QBQ40480.1 hypothetical protein E2P86_04660 [Sphingobacterium psychroaquaticum]SMG42483.1 hypothetical protein SAMN05660862_3018 [Sphingobacterium psychroaquaticum]